MVMDAGCQQHQSQRWKGMRKGKTDDAYLGRTFQAALDNMEFLFAGGKFLLQTL